MPHRLILAAIIVMAAAVEVRAGSSCYQLRDSDDRSLCLAQADRNAGPCASLCDQDKRNYRKGIAGRYCNSRLLRRNPTSNALAPPVPFLTAWECTSSAT